MFGRLLSVTQLWLIVPAALTFVVVATRADFVPELWARLNCGQLIDFFGSSDSASSVAFLAMRDPGLDRAWLADGLLAQAMTAGGLPLVRFISAVVVATLIGLLTWLTYQRCREPRVAFLLVAVAWPFIVLNDSARFETLGQLLFLTQIAVLWHADRLGRTALWACVAIQVLWGNTDTTFVLGILTSLVFLLGRMLDLVILGARHKILSDPAVRQFASITLAVMLASLVHPAPWDIGEHILESLETLAAGIFSLNGPTVRRSPPRILFVLSVAAALTIVNFSRRRLPSSELVLLTSTLILEALSPVGTVWYALVLAPTLAGPVRSLWPIRPRGPRLPHPAESMFNLVFLLMLIGLVTVSTPWTKGFNPVLPASRLAQVAPGEPWGAVEYLDQRGTSGPIFTTQAWSGYVAWQLGPEVQVPLASCGHTVTEQALYTFRVVAEGRRGWETLLDRWHVDVIVWPARDDQLTTALLSSPDWQLVFYGATARVFVRREPPADPSDGSELSQRSIPID